MPELHAKVFLFESCAVVGSANVSTYGLPSTELEGRNPWEEAGVVMTDDEILKKVKKWYKDIILKQATKITPGDLEDARAIRESYQQYSLFDTMRCNPGFFEKKDKWHLAIYENQPDKQEIRAALEAEGDVHNTGLFPYVDYDGVEPGMQIIEFQIKPRQSSKPQHIGVFRTVSKHIIGETPYCLAYKTHNFIPACEKASMANWKDFIEYIVAQKSSVWKKHEEGKRGILLPVSKIITLLKQYYNNAGKTEESI